MALAHADTDQLAIGGTLLEFNDDRIDNVRTDATFENCRFSNFGLKGAKFEGGVIRYCDLEDVYLRGASFKDVDLTGTTFTGCNLRHAHFSHCKLWYVSFKDCQLDHEAVLQSAPTNELSLRKLLIHNLRMNAESTGESRVANDLLMREMEVDRKEQWNIFRAASQYHKDKFSTADRWRALRMWILHWVERTVWGYGLRITSLAQTAVTIVLLASCIFYFSGTEFFVPDLPPEPQVRALGLLESIYVATVAFSTLGFGDFAPATGAGRIVAAALSLSGAVSLGLLAATAYKRIQR